MRHDLLSDGGRRTELPRPHRRHALVGSVRNLGTRTARTLAAASLLLGVGFSLADGAAATAAAAPIVSGSGPTGIALNADIPPSDDGMVHLTLIPGASEARYTMLVQTLGQAPKPASCATRAVTGDIVLTPDGAVVPELSKISVDMRTLTCAAPLSSSRAQSLLETSKYPFAEFVVQQAPGLTLPLPDGQTTDVQYLGDQTVHGVTRPVAYASTSTAAGAEMTGQSTTQIKMTDFNMTPPSIGPLVHVSDDMTVDLNFRAAVTAPPASDDANEGGEQTP